MAITQLAVFIENQKGCLSEVIRVLSENDINLRAMSIADTTDFGILRIIVNDTEKAKNILSKDYIVKTTDVIAVKMDDKRGALYNVLKVLEDAEINVEYSYAFTAGTQNNAYVVFRVDDVDSAEKLLKGKGFEFIKEEDI